MAYGYYVMNSSLVCPACAGVYETKDLEEAANAGYPDGFTCDDCGKVVRP